MKTIILIMSLVTILSACGKKEGVAVLTEIKGSDPLNEEIGGSTESTIKVDNFIGVYDLVGIDEGDCGASLQIINLCGGVQVRNNHFATESFCNINKGEVITGDNRSSKNVTMEANVIKSVSLLFDERSTPPGRVKQTLISILTLEADGTLRKLKQTSSCLYQKR